ncbi:hypothetical protein HNQ07_002982 [Deinococcus metalli]|uniref:VWA7 N-terminal domain-containing protein n=1 Tax=Deinococcus metalli TaxID=1141878 RepID=A0A7W8KGI9_9DEIO|nr:hypothetical protein [Deinococcus metalli]MBB5377490.1 hypothetical protein [Deinococcus metalli]GHF50828.1 hypothetical protein GCM10017781_29190 [Deinococcus metalli]
MQHARAATTLLGLALCSGGTGYAFDTGHHADLTREVLAEAGMNDTAIRAAQVENWLVDYYSSSPTAFGDVQSAAEKLHADNLFSPAAVTNYWDRYVTNARAAFHEAATRGDARQVVALLGMSLHSVQDFYSHSNWAELQPPPSGVDYATLTWFDAPAARRAGVKTGKASTSNAAGQTPHGGYSSGMNHDSYVRPNWDRAYVLAYAGARQWVNQARLWVSEVNPNVWNAARTLTLSGEDMERLGKDQEALYRISEWVKNVSGSEDGHWKGNGSGVRTDFLGFSAKWVALTLDSVFEEDFKTRKWHQLLAGGLRGALDLNVNAPPPAPAPAVARVALNKRAVVLRTVSARDLNNADGVFGVGGNADMYARIRVQNQEFIEAMQLDRESIRPAWTTIRFIDADIPFVSVHYELWDEDGVLNGDDEHLDVHPDGRFKNLDFLFNMTTHRVGGIGLDGVFDSDARLLTIQGTASDRARIQFFITSRTLARTVIRPFPGRPPVLQPIEPPVLQPTTP